MGEIIDLHSVLVRTLDAGSLNPAVADELPTNDQIEMIKSKITPSNAYSKAARAQLLKLGWGVLCATPEELSD
jgi:hypothetical protein